MSTPHDQTPDPQADPQTHIDTDPVNAAPDPEVDLGGDPVDGSAERAEDDATDDPAHDAGEDEGWESEGGATPSGPATDT